MYVIRCVNDAGLYWNNGLGWTDFNLSEYFTDYDHKIFNLPIEGEWVKIDIIA